MEPTRGASLSALVSAVVVALVVGVVGLWAVFADIAPKGSAAWRWSLTAIVYAGGAAVVGALVPRRWYLALLAAWGPVTLGLLGLITKLVSGAAVPYWSFLALVLVFVPAVALLFGYLGTRAVRRTAPGPGAAG